MLQCNEHFSSGGFGKPRNEVGVSKSNKNQLNECAGSREGLGFGIQDNVEAGA